MAWHRQATSHYLNQCLLVYRRIYASLGLNELISFKHNSQWFCLTGSILISSKDFWTPSNIFPEIHSKETKLHRFHYSDVIMGAMASQITSVSIVCSCRLFSRRSENTPKFRVTGLYERNPPVTGGFSSQRASNAETVPLWWCHHVGVASPDGFVFLCDPSIHSLFVILIQFLRVTL